MPPRGGDTRVLDDYSLFEQPAARYELLAEQDGYIVANDAEKIGSASVLLGAGRQKRATRWTLPLASPCTKARRLRPQGREPGNLLRCSGQV